MRLVKKALRTGALVLALSGCEEPPRNYNVYVDLNGDKKQEVVAGNYGKEYWGYREYDLTAKFSNPDRTYGKPKLIMKFRGRPNQVEFSDLDGDGDLDLVFSKYGKEYWRYREYNTFVARNDGKGNFGEPELINTQKK